MSKLSSSFSIVIAFIAAPLLAPNAYGNDDEVARFQAIKQQRLNPFLLKIKSGLEKAWLAPQHSGVLITKLELKLNQNGQLVRKAIAQSSGNDAEDRSVTNTIESYSFGALPPDFKEIDLRISFMSDGSMNLVEVNSGSGGDQSPRVDGSGSPAKVAQADLDFGPYMADLQRRIKRAWFPPKGHEYDRVTVKFKVHQHGELSNLQLDRSSGVAISDQAALKAVENGAPFKALPDGAPDPVDIQFTFDYNVFNGGHGPRNF